MQRHRNGHAKPHGFTERNADRRDEVGPHRYGREVPDFSTRILEPEDPFDAEEEIARYLARKHGGLDD